MARITEAAFDEQALKARKRSGQATRALPPIVPAAAGSALSLVLVAVGAGALMAPADLPVAGDLLALGTFGLGAYLLGRGPRDDARETLQVRAVDRHLLATERSEVIRAALAVASISIRDGSPERAHAAERVAAAVEPRADGADDGEARRGSLHAFGRDADGESLELDADAAVLTGAGPR